nr:phosphatase 2a regulatory subunit [Hymenolepis microstoma]
MDELFIRWLTDEVTQAGLNQSLALLKVNDRLEARRALRHIMVPGPQSSNTPEALPAVPSLHSPCSSPRPLTPPHFPNAHRQSQSPRTSTLPSFMKYIVSYFHSGIRV